MSTNTIGLTYDTILTSRSSLERPQNYFCISRHLISDIGIWVVLVALRAYRMILAQKRVPGKHALLYTPTH